VLTQEAKDLWIDVWTQTKLLLLKASADRTQYQIPLRLATFERKLPLRSLSRDEQSMMANAGKLP